MKQGHCPAHVATFGDYQFDFFNLELRKSQIRVRLETKPAQVLALLLTRAGHLVTRQELHQSLWPYKVHIDFEHGLNKSIHKLRAVLSDDSARPRFVQRIRRRGYRFIASVEFGPCPVALHWEALPSASRPESPHSSATDEVVLASSSVPIVPRLLPIKDAATYLSASNWQIETLLREGTIRSFRVGKRRVVDRLELDRLIEHMKLSRN